MTKKCVKVPLMFESEDDLQSVINLLMQYGCQFDTMWEISPIQVGGKVGFVNWELGEVIVKPEYDKYAGPLSCHTPYNCVEKDGLWGVLCYDGKLETPIAHSKFVAMMIRDNLNMRVRIELAADPELHIA